MEKGLFSNYLDQKGESKKIAISISIGVASSEGTDPERVLSQADKLMYKDKSIFYSRNTSMA
ncbi:MAG: diguanylate cyclase [Deltaproteobacteria bacterium]|nr:diguanylate cyclase [Deltaproteobacteria bacterium]